MLTVYVNVSEKTYNSTLITGLRFVSKTQYPDLKIWILRHQIVAGYEVIRLLKHWLSYHEYNMRWYLALKVRYVWFRRSILFDPVISRCPATGVPLYCVYLGALNICVKVHNQTDLTFKKFCFNSKKRDCPLIVKHKVKLQQAWTNLTLPLRK